ncbi:MAG: hypothetical protein PHF72_11855 [Gammaproteobacteria bacterium]|nr:hypothetical protein [Gammaproteobacteria bacterium]
MHPVMITRAVSSNQDDPPFATLQGPPEDGGFRSQALPPAKRMNARKEAKSNKNRLLGMDIEPHCIPANPSGAKGARRRDA